MHAQPRRKAGRLTTAPRRARRAAGRIAVIAAAPVVALSLLGSGPFSQDDSTTRCSVMAHPPAVQTDPGSGNPLTRPGQVGRLNQLPPPNSDMPMDCPSIGHG